jgi:hypothetical protein
VLLVEWEAAGIDWFDLATEIVDAYTQESHRACARVGALEQL